MNRDIHAPDASRLKINAWVADKTAGKITELLAPEMITDLTRLVLANAVYFNAAWENPFNALYNHANNFTLLDGSIATRSFMYASQAMLDRPRCWSEPTDRSSGSHPRVLFHATYPLP
jgi:serine protease inhibitor